MKPRFKLFLLIILVVGAIHELPLRALAAQQTETLSLSNFALPESLGKVDERYAGTSERWVINIQDVHGHPSAQENIAAILEHLQVVYGVSTVGVEGAWRATSFPDAWGIPNSREKQQLARWLLDDGYLTGPAYAALFSPMPIHLVGIEDSKLYEENRAVYLEYLGRRKAIQEKIASFSKQLELEKADTFNSELLSFDRKLHSFREGQKAEKFLPEVIQTAGSKNIDFSGLDQVVLFSKIMMLSGQIQKEALQAEAERLGKAYKTERLSFEELLRSGKVPQDQLQFYTESQKYLELIKLQDRLAHHAFFDQIEALIGHVKRKLITSDAEKLLDQKSERFALAKKLLDFQAAPKDLAQFKKDETEIRAVVTEAFGVGAIHGENSAASLHESPLHLSLRFYELAKERDEIFFKKLASDERLKGNVAVVAGGFHTDGLREQLRKAGISYLVVTPDLAGESPNEEMYFRKLKAGAGSPRPGLSGAETAPLQPDTQTLSPVNQAVQDEDFENQFSFAMSELRQTKNIQTAGEMIVNAAGQETVSAPETSIQDTGFLGLSPDEQVRIFKQAVLDAQSATEPLVFFAEAKALQGLIQAAQDETADSLVGNFVNDRHTTLVAAGEPADIPSRVKEGQIKLEVQTGTLPEVIGLNSTRFKKLMRDHAAAMTEDSAKITGIPLKFPVRPEALLFRLILSSAQIRASFLANPNGTLNALRDLLARHETLRQLLKAA